MKCVCVQKVEKGCSIYGSACCVNGAADQFSKSITREPIRQADSAEKPQDEAKAETFPDRKYASCLCNGISPVIQERAQPKNSEVPTKLCLSVVTHLSLENPR